MSRYGYDHIECGKCGGNHKGICSDYGEDEYNQCTDCKWDGANGNWNKVIEWCPPCKEENERYWKENAERIRLDKEREEEAAQDRMDEDNYDDDDGKYHGDYYAETFEAKEIMDCSLCGNNLSPIPKNYNGDSLGAYLNNHRYGLLSQSSFLAIGECNNCNLTYFSPPIRDGRGLKSKVLCNNWAVGDGEGGFCAYPFDWNDMWEKRCEKCESGLHGRKGEIDRLNEHDCMDNSKVEIIEGDMILLECEICKKTKQYVSNQKSFNVEFNEWADQEMNSHGKNISFKDWSKDEGMKHGNTEITEWAQHEDESHDARYGAESTDSFWDWEDPTDGKDLFKLTKLEDKVLTKFKGLLYNWGSEPGYSDVFEPELRKKCNITKAKMSEVLSSLVDKDLVALHDHEFKVEDKRSRWGGYKLVTQVLVYPLANMYVYFNEYEGLEGHWRETPSIFGAEKKRSGILSDPFEEASLDSGEWKGILTGFGIGLLGLFGYSKLRK